MIVVLSPARRHVLGALGLLFVVALAGCGAPSAQDLALDKDTARNSLMAFLDCWKAGGEPDALKALSPAIIGRDTDWDAGNKLVRYTLGAVTDDGTNLHVTTELMVASRSGQAAKTVNYIVGTSPVITVFRNE
jgi:hypothetical protein